MRILAFLGLSLFLVAELSAASTPDANRRDGMRVVEGVRWTADDPAAEAARRLAGLPTPLRPDDLLRVAGELRTEGKALEARHLLEKGYRATGDLRVAREAVASLLALSLWESADALVAETLRRHPGDGELLESAALLAAERGQHADATDLLDQSVRAGRDPLAWLGNGGFARFRAMDPFRRRIDADAVVASLDRLDAAGQVDRLALLRRIDAPFAAPVLAAWLAPRDENRVLLAGLALLESRRDTLPIATLLTAPGAKARHWALLSLRDLRDPAALAAVERLVAMETDAGNRDLAAVVLTELQAVGLEPAAALAMLAPFEPTNRFRGLVDVDLAAIHRSVGDHEAAAAAEKRAVSSAHATPVEPSGELSDYWECMERTDITEMRTLLEHHEQVERIDGRIYGLPENDFDDQKNLTVAERLFLRRWADERKLDWPTEGPMQYPREIRHTLRRIAGAPGTGIDCAGLLTPAPTRAMGEDGTEVKVEEDTGVDNETNIVINPYDQRYVIATSNDYDGATGNDSYRSSDWGNTWTSGDVAIAGNCCDPVTQYTRTSVSGTPTDVAYHSTLTNPVSLLYSTNNGSTWTACSGTVGGSGADRQDHVVDTNPSSPCYNKVYLGFHLSGTQWNSTTTGATFPFCQTFNPQSTAVGGTIGSAMVVSTNGTAHNIFTQYTPGNVYHSRTTNCGTSWTTSSILPINNGGDFEWGIPSTCSRQVYYYPQADTDRQPSSAFLNNIYVVFNDLSSACTPPGCAGNTTCNNDIFLATGVPNNRANPTSWTWSKVNLTSSITDAYTDEFYPSLAVDPADGSVYVSYYRTGSGAGGNIAPRRDVVHYVAMRSTNGGVTWETPVQITNLPTNESCCGANSAMQWGDYTWNDVVNGVLHTVWTDRRESADEDVWSSKVCSEPAHWSERAPTYATAVTTAAPSGALQITVSWTLPDLYWGDGGENPAARKFQLWVDGSLAQDNISAASTSTTWTATDCSTPHSFQVRAVNQCGVSKSYTTVNATATGCCVNSPSSVTVTPGGPLTLCAGTGQLLSASISGGTGPFGYQWTRDGVNIGGANGSTYTASDTGTHTYNCKVTGSGCTDGTPDPTPTSLTWVAAPTFAGLASVTNPSNATCTLNLSWAAGSTSCPGPVVYNVYRSTTNGFTPAPANRIATGVVGTSYGDTVGLVNGTTYYYVVRAVESSNAVEETNVVQRSGVPTGPVSSGNLADTFEGAQSGGGFDLAGWTHSALSGAVDWIWSTNRAQSPTHSWYSASQASASDRVLVSPSFGVLASTTLSFWHTYDFEGTVTTCYDGGTLEISTDGGTNWSVVPDAAFTAGGFTGTVNSCCANPIAGRRAWCDGTIGTFSQVQVNLASFAGQTARIRWREGDDSSLVATGWNVDTIAINNAGSASSCATGSASAAKPVPDGDFVAGSPLRGTKTGATVTTTWDVATCASTNYNVYRGTIGSWGAVTGGSCTIGVTGTATSVTMPNDSWWVVAGTGGGTVGSFGRDSANAQRVLTGWGAGGVCPTETSQSLSGTCP